MPVPAATIPILRAAFQSQGIPQAALDDAGNINLGALASMAYDQVIFRSAVTPDIPLNMTELGPPEPGVASWIKPMVVFTGKAGQVVVAPSGEPWEYGWLVMPAVVLGLVGFGYVLGRMR